MQREYKSVFFLFLPHFRLNMLLKFLITHKYTVLIGELFDFHNNSERVEYIDNKHAEKHSDNKRKRKITRKPFQRGQYMSVHENIVHSGKNAPEK